MKIHRFEQNYELRMTKLLYYNSLGSPLVIFDHNAISDASKGREVILESVIIGVSGEPPNEQFLQAIFTISLLGPTDKTLSCLKGSFKYELNYHQYFLNIKLECYRYPFCIITIYKSFRNSRNLHLRDPYLDLSLRT